MSNATQVNLATVGSDELQAMPIAVFNACLEQMSAEAIARFKRMRKLSEAQKAAVERALSEPAGNKKSGGKTGAAVSAFPREKAEAGKSPRNDATGSKQPVQASLIKDIFLRLVAWWEGVDTDALARSRGIKRWKRKPTVREAAAEPANEQAEEPAPPLTRVELLQKLWGDGFSLPGGAEFALRVAAPAKLAGGDICLDLAPGLGGGSRAVAQAAGARLIGIESDRELAQAAATLSRASGQTETASIRPAELGGLGDDDFGPAGQYAAIIMREAMFAVEDRGGMLSAIHRALRDDGSLLLTDFVLDGNPDRPISQAVAHWRAAEPDGAAPWTEAEYREALETADYIVERFDDLTAKYLPLVREGLRRFHDCLQNAKLPPETLPILMREGNLWLARNQALESGHLSLALIHARRALPAERPDLKEADAATEAADESKNDISMEQGREE